MRGLKLKLLFDLSLTYKTPLRISALVVITAVVVTSALVLRERDELRRDLIEHAESLARVLAKTLIEPIVNDDAWRTYEIINSPFHAPPGDAAAQSAELVMVLDAQRRIYVSTRPTDYPMLGNPTAIDADYASVHPGIAAIGSDEPKAIVAPSGRMFVVLPIVADGVELGTLVMAYSRQVFQPRFAALMQRAAVITAGALALLLPAGWYWGRRIARPLVELAQAMGQVGPPVPAQLAYVHRYRGRDEIGKLGIEFERMVRGLREKEALERQVIAADRLAAIGRLTAGIAHEINNPLGGMLNAISTFKRHGSDDSLTGKTLALIERGLLQIKETVAALLVEARVESHALTHQDIEDTRTLVLADAQSRGARLEWSNQVHEPLPLPSTPTRQVLINLLLNAVQAVEPGGRVEGRVAVRDRELLIEVSNDGRHIAEDQMHFLFEPFVHAGREGMGLGLWVTYQIVQQLGGRIEVQSRPGRTSFAVHLPLAPQHDQQAATVPG